MSRREPAALWWGSDFYEDRHVLLMTYEQQGVYQRLLWISWRNIGVPDDPALLAKMLGLPAKRFLARIWPAIAPCWSPAGEGLLVQKRQEEERARRAAARGDDEQPTEPADQERSARMRELARMSWEARRKAHADAQRKAHADAAPQSDTQSAPHLPPAPPSVPNQEKPTPTRDAQRNADAQCAPQPEGADAAQSAEADDKVPVVQLQLALLATAYRSNLKGFLRSREVLKRAEALILTGLCPDDVRELAEHDRRKADTPGALLAHWLDEGIWREVLDESANKSKERDLRQRKAAAEDPLQGVYGA